MRLYPKRLRNIEDLEREKKLLARERKQFEEEDFLSIDGLFGKKGSKEDDKEGSLLDFLPISNPLVGIIVKMISSRLSKKNNDKQDDIPKQDTTKKKGRSVLHKLVFEFIGGYLKWKAIELSFKGIRHIIKTRRAGNEEQ